MNTVKTFIHNTEVDFGRVHSVRKYGDKGIRLMYKDKHNDPDFSQLLGFEEEKTRDEWFAKCLVAFKLSKSLYDKHPAVLNVQRDSHDWIKEFIFLWEQFGLEPEIIKRRVGEFESFIKKLSEN